MTDADSGALRVQLLGPVRAWRGERELELGGPRRRALLGMLAHARQAVSRGALIDGLWGSEPPASAENSVHVYIAGLRRVLEPRRAPRAPSQFLTGAGDGYRLRLAPGTLDTEVLGQRMADARRLAAEDPAAAARALDAALGLWQGASLAGIPGSWAEIERARLDELRQTATADRIDIMLTLGSHHEALAELAALIRQHPLQERFHGQLMLALYRCGRQADALGAFAHARRALADQLGIDPGPALQRLHQQILTADTALDLPQPGGRVKRTLVPRELPAGVNTFTGRSAELAALDQLLAAGGRADRDSAKAAALTCVVAGTAGVGKTALAVHWGHRVRDAFPGGQLYVDLRGYDPGEPVTAAGALAGFLRALGVAARDIPADVGERAACYRSLLDGRRALVVLDNAASVEQVRPLLPGTPSCVVVVTSRDSLAGLVARHGAHRLGLDLLPAGDAVGLLRELIGERVAAEPVAAATLAGQCARLPLALRVAAELAAVRPDMDLAELACELADEERRLDLLDAGGDPRTAVRAVFSWSYRRLPADVARAFRLIGLHPGPDLDTFTAAALTGTSAQRAADLLRQLARGHLIYRAAPGRYAMHDLLRAYAAGAARPEEARAWAAPAAYLTPQL
ncbi:MAG TPA: AfsR/SARP family transcriptional regulator [Trebonia sp.]|nr:AfsR/SARP family transcriptional regulator [Trebonia sp.]